MKKAIIFITGIDLFFILLIGIAGLFQGVAGDLLHYLAFILPIFIGFIFVRREKGEEEAKISFGMKPSALPQFLPLIFPATLAIIGVSFLTNLILTSLGYLPNSMPSEDFITALLIHALLPAACEELLFRYIPIKLLLPHSGRWCIILSSIYFAMSHGNFFTIPYAALAGLIFVLIDIKFSSVLPSFILHLFNNALALFIGSEFFVSVPEFILPLIFVMATAASALIIFIKRKSYSDLLNPFFDKKRTEEVHYAPLIFVCVTVIVAFVNLAR